MKTKTKNPYFFEEKQQKMDPILKIVFVTIAILTILGALTGVLHDLNKETQRKFPSTYGHAR